MTEGPAYWVEMWRELSLLFRKPTEGARRGNDPWRERASRFDASGQRRRSEGRDVLVDALGGGALNGHPLGHRSRLWSWWAIPQHYRQPIILPQSPHILQALRSTKTSTIWPSLNPLGDRFFGRALSTDAITPDRRYTSTSSPTPAKAVLSSFSPPMYSIPKPSRCRRPILNLLGETTTFTQI